jgi:hypothetical protein
MLINWVFDRYLGLGLREKVVVGVMAAVALFFVSYLGTLLVLSLSGAGEEWSAPAGASAPGITYTEDTQAQSPVPNLGLRITSVRWEEDRVLVEGTWKGDLSSVHCDLLEGGSEGRAIDWWDRGVSATMSWSDRTFAQKFVEAEGRKIEDPIDPTNSYAVVCSGQFSAGWSVNDTAAVEGTPPGA